MIAQVTIASNEFTADVKRAGVENITSELHDEDGNLSIGSASVNLSNLYGTLAPVLAEIPTGDVRIQSGGFDLFEGKIKQGGFSYDFDQETLSLTMLDSQKFIVDTFEKMLLSDLINKADNNTVLHASPGQVRDAADLNAVKVYDFYRLPRIIREILYEFNLRYAGTRTINDAEIEVPDEYAIGGGTSSLPQTSCRAFLNDVARLINGFWWIDPTTRKFHIVPKAKLVAQRLADTPVQIAVKRDTLKASDDYAVPNQISLTFNNTDQIPAREIDWKNLAKGTVGNSQYRFNRDVKLGFNAPRIALRRTSPVVIESDGDHDNYLVKLGTGGFLPLVTHVTAEELLNRYHKFETDATTSLSLACVHSLLFDTALLGKWPTIYTHVQMPAYGGRSFFVRSAEVSLDEETCDLHLVSYEPH